MAICARHVIHFGESGDYELTTATRGVFQVMVYSDLISTPRPVDDGEGGVKANTKGMYAIFYMAKLLPEETGAVHPVMVKTSGVGARERVGIVWPPNKGIYLYNRVDEASPCGTGLDETYCVTIIG